MLNEGPVQFVWGNPDPSRSNEGGLGVPLHWPV